MKGHDRIIIDPEICHGKPIIRGTRMPVSFVLGKNGVITKGSHKGLPVREAVSRDTQDR